MFKSSTPTAHRRLAARPSSAALLDVAVAATTLAGSLALLARRHLRDPPGAGMQAPPRGVGGLNLVGVVLAACSPLLP